MASFSDRVRDLRKSKNMTQRQMAEALSITERSYQRYEADNNPNNETLLKLADYFNVSTDYILGRSDEPIPTGNEIFARRLVECRKSRKVTEEDVAEYLAMNADVYLKYEAAFYSPSIDMLNKLAEYFKTSVDYLVGYKPPDGIYTE